MRVQQSVETRSKQDQDVEKALQRARALAAGLSVSCLHPVCLRSCLLPPASSPGPYEGGLSKRNPTRKHERQGDARRSPLGGRSLTLDRSHTRYSSADGLLEHTKRTPIQGSVGRDPSRTPRLSSTAAAGPHLVIVTPLSRAAAYAGKEQRNQGLS